MTLVSEAVSNLTRVPEPGEALPVADGILWIRMPLPFRLDHVNLWALDEGDGWTIVDCGPDTPDCRAAWDALMAGGLGGRPVRRIVATHGHLDHVGLAGSLVTRFGVPYHITLGEYFSARLRHYEAGMPAGAHLAAFLRAHGCDEGVISGWVSQRMNWFGMLGPQPDSFMRMRDGDELILGRRRWRVMTAGGHAPEHASLYCEDDGILIAGDQVLPKITPVIGVFAEQPQADPLKDYLASLPRFAALGEERLVLPSHGTPFSDLAARCRDIMTHHDERLARVLPLVGDGASAWAVAGGLFARAVAGGQGRLALAETLAHINRLVATGDVGRHVAADGAITFTRRG